MLGLHFKQQLDLLLPAAIISLRQVLLFTQVSRKENSSPRAFDAVGQLHFKGRTQIWNFCLSHGQQAVSSLREGKQCEIILYEKSISVEESSAV